MVIDFGTYSKEETLALGVFVGDSVVVDGPFVKSTKTMYFKSIRIKSWMFNGVELLKSH